MSVSATQSSLFPDDDNIMKDRFLMATHSIAANDATFEECDLQIDPSFDHCFSSLTQSLMQNSSLKKLRLRSIIRYGNNSLSSKELAIALKISLTLTDVDLRLYGLTDLNELAHFVQVNWTLKRLSLNGNPISGEVEKAFATALKVNATLTELVLEFCQLTDIKELSEAFKVNRSIKKLNLSNNQFTNAGEVALASVLKANNVLIEVDLVCCSLSGAELAEGLKVNRSVTKLNLFANSMSKAGQVVLGSALKENFSLRDLSLMRCNLTNIKEIAEGLLKNRSLTKLDLTENSFGDAGVSALADSLKLNDTLTMLDLSKCGLLGIGDLAETLKSNRTLKSLNVGWNIHCVAPQQLGAALKDNSGLTELDMSGCCRHFESLPEALKINRTLLKLSLCGDSIGLYEEHVNAIINVLKKDNSTLTELNLRESHFTGITNLASMLTSNRSLKTFALTRAKFDNIGCKAIAAAIKVNFTLTSLDIGWCGIFMNVKEFIESFAENRSIRQLSFQGNDIENIGSKAFADVLRINDTISDLDLGWCRISDISELGETLKNNSSLTRLSLRENYLGKAGGNALLAALKVNTTLVDRGDFSNDKIDDIIKNQIDERIRFNKSLKQQVKQSNTKEKEAKTIASAAAKPANLASGAPKIVQPPQAVVNPVIPVIPPAAVSPNNLKVVTPVPVIGGQINAVAASLDQVMIDQLKALPAKHEALAKEVQRFAVIDIATLEMLVGRANQLERMFEEDAKAVFNKQEKDLIKENPNLQIYNLFFARLLSGTWMACQSINSGMVGNAESSNADYFTQGLDQIGQRITGLGLATGFLSLLMKGWSYREKKQAVQRMSMLFSDLETAFKELSQFSRQATLAQRKEILSLQAPQGIVDKLKEGIKDLVGYIVASDANTPLKRKAEEDCNKILTAIKEGRLPQQPNMDELLSVIMGVGFKYQSPISANAVSSSKVSPSHASASSPVSALDLNVFEIAEQLRKLQAKDADREMEKKRLEAEMIKMKEDMAKLKSHLPPDSDVEAGQDQLQLQISKSKQRATNPNSATSHAVIIHHTTELRTEIAVIKAKQNEQDSDILANKANLAAIKQQTDRQKETCIIA